MMIAWPLSYMNNRRTQAGGGGDPDAHRYWRVFISANDGDGSNTRVTEVELRNAPGGSDVCAGGTAIASGGTAANAFDNSTATTWDVAATSNAWIGYDFGSNPQNIVEFALTAGTTGLTGLPRTFKLQWSDDNSTWNDATGPAAGTFTVSLWIVSHTRTFPETLATGFHRYWRLMLLTQNGGTNQFRVNEIEFRATAGGADQCVNVGSGLNTASGRIIATSGDSAPDNAFDNTFDDFWYGQGATNRYNGQVFLSPIKVEEISVQCATNTTTRTPATAEIQHSDDGLTWTAQKSLTFGTWVSNTAQVLSAI